MKKVYLLLLIGLVLGGIGWFAFRQVNTREVSNSKIKIVTTMPLLKNLVEKIGGTEVSVSSIVKGSSCNHEYEPSTGDMKLAAEASIIVKTGMGSDDWVDHLLADISGKKKFVIDCSKGLTTIITEEHSDSAPETGHNLPGNPHYWGNPDNIKTAGGNILKGLSKVMPEKAGYFKANYQQFTTELDRTVAELKAVITELPDRRIVSYSAAFPYFFAYFGFDNLATVETTCEQEISSKHLVEVANLTKVKRIKVIVGEEVYPKAAANFAKETGSRLVLLWPATNESGDYLVTLKENVRKMVNALK